MIEWYKTQISKLPIQVHLQTEISDVSKLDAGEVIVATGSKARKIGIPGFDLGVEAVDYLLGNKPVGDTVVVVGGGLTGCEIAFDLARKGKKPIIVEMTDELIKAVGVCAANSECLRDYMRYYQVPLYMESTVKQINEDSVVIETKEGEKVISCDSVVLSVGYVSDALCEANETNHVHVIGDAAKVGNLKTVIQDAYDVAFSLK